MSRSQRLSHSYLVAESHPPEYMIHKYWARKPHNILSMLIRDLVPNGGLVLDPFCGSGVFLTEALAAGCDGLGIDLNPISGLLSRVSTAPPAPAAFDDAVAPLLDKAASRFGCEYNVDLDGAPRTVRYAVHATISRCKECGKAVSALDARKTGRIYRCPACNGRVHFNLANLQSTRTFRVVFTDRTSLQSEEQDHEVIELQQQLAYVTKPGDDELFAPYDRPLLTNRRILAFPGLTVKNFFTNRAFRFACTFVNWINEISDEQAREAVLLWLTSSLAQFSRLIPYRNNLTTGGPAWTVPGFWVAPIHLEANPISHLEARAAKFTRGLKRLQKRLGGKPGNCRIFETAAQEALDDLHHEDVTVDAVFLDPPYGDSVPYLEFSQIWNAFVGPPPDYDAEIVVSDRSEKRTSWQEYEEGLVEVFGKCARILKPDGHVIVTFNNLKPRAWYALLCALYSAGLRCCSAWYQVPAVVSAKAQFAPRTSFVGDFYCVYQLAERDTVSNQKEEPAVVIANGILRTLSSRGNVAAKNIVLRSALLAILRENLSPTMLNELDEIFDRLLVEQGDYYQVKPEHSHVFTEDVPLLAEIVMDVATKILENGSCKWSDLYAEIMEETDSVGVPSTYEVRQILEERVSFEGKTVYSRSDQIQLF